MEKTRTRTPISIILQAARLRSQELSDRIDMDNEALAFLEEYEELEAALTNFQHPPCLLVTLEGGCCTSVMGTTGLRGIGVVLRDFDNIKTGDDDPIAGTVEEAGFTEELY